jgi:hypothetical protein
MNASGSWSGQPPNISSAWARFGALVVISLFLGGVGSCGAGLSAHVLPSGADSDVGVRGAVLMYRDVNALGGKLRRLVGLYVASDSSSGPSRLVRSGVGLLLGSIVIVVLFCALSAGVFLLALNCPPGPCGGSMRLFGGLGMLGYVCFTVLMLVYSLLSCLLYGVAWMLLSSPHWGGTSCHARIGSPGRAGWPAYLIHVTSYHIAILSLSYWCLVP